MTKLPFPVLKNHLTLIRNATRGQNYLFRNLHMSVSGKTKDILQNGNKSCAVFVASLLYLENSLAGEELIGSIHATVNGTIADLERHGWHEISRLRPGAILLWEDKLFPGGETHSHIGFYLEKDTAVSNDTDLGFPMEHHSTYGIENGKPVRKILKMYWHPALDR